MPLEVCHAHLLAGAVVHAAKDIHAVVEVLGAVKESCERHRCKLHELKSLQVQDHGVFCSGTIVVTTKDNNLVARYENSCLCLHRKRELDQ